MPMLACPNCGEHFDAEAHQSPRTEGGFNAVVDEHALLRCPACGHEFQASDGVLI
jgi:uncharacterized C2H2 Zn-finger protein